MSFKIIRNDITKVKADVIVNSANPEPVIGGGTDSAIYKAAGEAQLLAKRREIGKIARGEVAVTPAFGLKAKYIIHTVGAIWQDGNHGEKETLAKCYENSLAKCVELGCRSIAFPLISSGIYGFPDDQALRVAMAVIQEFLLSHKLDVTLVVFNPNAYHMTGQIFDKVQAFVDNNYVEQSLKEEYGFSFYSNESESEYFRYRELPPVMDESGSCQTMPDQPAGRAKNIADFDFDAMLAKKDKTFQEKLFELIDERGLKDSYVYNTAHMSRAFFSKLRMDPDYQPTKRTVLTIAIVLKLNYYETVDLLQRAGLAFSNSQKQDLYVQGFIQNQFYDLLEIDAFMIQHGLETLRKF